MGEPTVRLRRQAGSVLVLIAMGIVALLGAGALSVDVGFFFVMRNQLQNAVDAAALAGAQGLIIEPGDYSDNGQAKKLAIQVAALNQAAGQPVILASNEITFPDGNTVLIRITRPAQTFFARVLGVSLVNITVSAAAMAVPVESVSGGPGGGGMRPWAVLDQFGHGALCVPPNDADINVPPHGPFKDTPHTWRGITVNSDHYKSPYDPEFAGWDLSREADCSTVTGFIAPRDVTGERVYLKEFKNGPNPWRTPGNFGAVALGGRGAANYRDNIINGYAGTIQIGDVLETEPGNMAGPTKQGIAELIAKDPTAKLVRRSGRWVVESRAYPINESPRIVPIPMYSVYTGPGNGRSDFTVTSIAAFFIEGTDGKDVWGRFIYTRSKTSAAGESVTNAGSQTVGGGGRLLATVRLVDAEDVEN